MVRLDLFRHVPSTVIPTKEEGWRHRNAGEPRWRGWLQSEDWRVALFPGQRRRFEPQYSQLPAYPVWSIIADRLLQDRLTEPLDIGCGPGQFASLLRDRGLRHYVGIDTNPLRIAHARQICPEFGFRREDVFESDVLVCEPYDSVICTEFLDQVEADTTVVACIRAGARFFGSLPASRRSSSIRGLRGAAGIRRRYGRYFDSFRIDLVTPRDKGPRYYLIDGVRRPDEWMANHG